MKPEIINHGKCPRCGEEVEQVESALTSFRVTLEVKDKIQRDRYYLHVGCVRAILRDTIEAELSRGSRSTWVFVDIKDISRLQDELDNVVDDPLKGVI